MRVPRGVISTRAASELASSSSAPIATLGDPRIKSFDLAIQTSPTGCAGHPTVATHQKMADTLTAELAKELGW